MYASMKETKLRTPEYLSQDILDDEFVGTFKFFHRMQYILGSSRVDAKDRFVTAPTSCQKAYTIFCIIATFIFNIAVLKLYYTAIRSGAIYHLTVFSIWYGFVSYVATVINARFINGQENADFFVQMQKVDRLMGLDKIADINIILKRINQSWLILLLLILLLMFLVSCTRFNILYFSFAGSVYSQITEMVELIFGSNLMIYFVIRVRFINCIMKNHLNRAKATVKKDVNIMLSYRHLKELARTRDFITSDTHTYLKELFDLFSAFQNLYRFQLLIFCLKLVNGSLCVFGIILFSIQKNAVDIMEVASMVLFQLIDICIAVFMGIRLQFFFGEIKETKRLSIAVMAENSSGHLREKASKMLKMAEETPPRLSVYDMFNMDAGIFLSIFGLLTNLIVTLLQFAFL